MKTKQAFVTLTPARQQLFRRLALLEAKGTITKKQLRVLNKLDKKRNVYV